MFFSPLLNPVRSYILYLTCSWSLRDPTLIGREAIGLRKGGTGRVTVLAKAMELGAAISQSDELKKVREAEQAMFSNPDARALIEEFQNYQQQVEVARARGVEPGSELQDTFRSVRDRMNGNQLISDYFAAQQEFNQILRQVNQILNHAITGDGGCTPDGCSTCGGSCGD